MSVALGSSLDERLEALFALDPRAVEDHDSILRRVREGAPVRRFGGMALVTRYEDVRAVLGDPARFSSTAVRYENSQARAAQARLDDPEQLRLLDEVLEFEANIIASRDGEHHQRLRRAAHRLFTPRRVAELQAAIEGYADELLDPLRSGDVVDMARIAYQLPLAAICDLVGVPAADRELVHGWVSGRIDLRRYLTSPTVAPDSGRLLAGFRAYTAFRDYVAELMAQHERSPGAGGPLMSALLDTRDDALTDIEILVLFMTMLTGGHETTATLISSGLFLVLREPGQWDALVAEPDLIPNAVEEMLRLTTPAGWILRRSTGPTDLRGEHVDADEPVLALIVTANRDPEVFPDPDRCDVRRAEARKNLVFGFGPHFCLGAALARFEADVFLRRLTARFPDLALTTDAVEFTGIATSWRPAELPIALG